MWDAMLKLIALPAGHGDTLWIETDSTVVIFDSGPSNFETSLVDRILALAKKGRSVDLLVISHIDDDHIGGILRFLSTERQALSYFKEIWFNGRRHLPPKREEFDVSQGVLLEKYLEKFEGWNRIFDGNTVSVETSPAKPIAIGDLEISVLSPNETKLERLATLWDFEVAKFDEGSRLEALKLAGKEEFAAKPVTKAVAVDQSKPNGSSIALLIAHEGKTILCCADAHPGLLAENVSKYKPHHGKFDLVVLPHHGSAANVTKKFLLNVPATNYLISTNSSKPNRPDARSLQRMREVDSCAGATVWFNYPIPMDIKAWFDSEAAGILACKTGSLALGAEIDL